jgi:hypothetical protein
MPGKNVAILVHSLQVSTDQQAIALHCPVFLPRILLDTVQVFLNCHEANGKSQAALSNEFSNYFLGFCHVCRTFPGV